MGLLNPFPVVRLRLQAVVERPVRWPEYQGSALRGLWGHALREQACVTGRPVCEGCPMQANCSYIRLFEPTPPTHARTYSDMTPPYVIEPGNAKRELDPGETYVFHQVLFGAAIEQWPLVLSAWRRAFSRRLGWSQGAMRLVKAQWVMWSTGQEANTPQVLDWQSESQAPLGANIVVHTPMFLKRSGRPLHPDALTAADIVWAAVRRVAEVSELHLMRDTGLDFAALKQAAQGLRLENPQWRFERFQRWSNRQKRHTPLTGITGTAELVGDIAAFWPVLQIAQALHLGGKTSFGLGAYTIMGPSNPSRAV